MPWSIPKLALLVAALGLLAPRRSLEVGRPRVFVALFCLFAFAFLLAPYWAVPARLPSRLLLACCLALLGILWAAAAASPMRLNAGERAPVPLIALGLILLLIHWRALEADLPWRGDEPSHVGVVLSVLRQPAWLVAAVVALTAVLCGKTERRSLRALLLVLVALTCLLVGRLYTREMETMWLRYPAATRWLQALPVAAWSHSPRLLHLEGLYRVVPFASTVLIAWAAFARAKPAPSIDRALIALAIATTPLLLYYASILYLELPAVLLMFVVCLDIRRLLRVGPPELRRLPSWFALLGIGFVKETTLPFLFAFIICRLALQLGRNPRLGTVAREASVTFAVSAPLLVYLLVTRGAGFGRGYALAFDNLRHLRLWAVLARSCLEQGGLLVVPALAGMMVLLRRGRHLEAAFFSLSLGSHALFHLLDAEPWIGYSRFNLFLLPPALAAALATVKELVGHGSWPVRVVAVVWLASNVLLSPVHADGSKKPNWGSPLIDTAEHYYPYRRTIEWLREKHPNARVVFAGLTYPYYLGFYFQRYGWRPELEVRIAPEAPAERRETLRQLAVAEGTNTVLVYHPLPGEAADGAAAVLAPFRLEHVVENAAHRLLLFSRAGQESETSRAGPVSRRPRR
jgi:hypothetical protein